ncbi:MAG: hypothetical protein RL557_533 [archaeon]
MKKKGEAFLEYNLVFMILVVIFLVFGVLLIVRYESYTAFYEQVYAKQLALVIDKAEPGMTMEIDITPLMNSATKNRFSGTVVNIDNNEHTVSVYLVEGTGYSHQYFNDVAIEWNIKQEERGLTLVLHFYEANDSDPTERNEVNA